MPRPIVRVVYIIEDSHLQPLLQTLRKEGFLPDTPPRQGVTCLAKNGVEAYITDQDGIYRLVLSPSTLQIAILPRFIDDLVNTLGKSGIQCREATKERKEYPYDQYPWDSPSGMRQLAGYQP